MSMKITIEDRLRYLLKLKSWVRHDLIEEVLIMMSDVSDRFEWSRAKRTLKPIIERVLRKLIERRIVVFREDNSLTLAGAA